MLFGTAPAHALEEDWKDMPIVGAEVVFPLASPGTVQHNRRAVEAQVASTGVLDGMELGHVDKRGEPAVVVEQNELFLLHP